MRNTKVNRAGHDAVAKAVAFHIRQLDDAVSMERIEKLHDAIKTQIMINLDAQGITFRQYPQKETT